MLRERIAELAHLIWQQWIGYMFANFDADHIKRWTQQANTFYENLSEAEKESDRAVADRYLTAIREAAEEGMPLLNTEEIKRRWEEWPSAELAASTWDEWLCQAQRKSDINWIGEEKAEDDPIKEAMREQSKPKGLPKDWSGRIIKEG